MLKPIKLDNLIENGLKKKKTVEAIFQEIAADPKIRQAVQDAIDANPPPAQVQGHPSTGPSPAQHIRQALLTALQA